MESNGNRNDHESPLRTIVGIGIVGFLAQAGWATLNFSALPMWVEYKLHQAQYLGVVLAAFMVTEAVMRPFLGSLSDRKGRKIVMLMGPLFGIFTSIATVWALRISPSALALIPLRAIDGIGLAGFWPAAYALIGDTFGEEKRGSSTSVLNGSAMAGIALGWLAGGAANDLTHTLSGSFYFVSMMFGLTVIAGLLILPEPPRRHHHAQEHEGWLHVPKKSELVAIAHSVPDMLALNVVMFAGFGILMPIFKLYAVQRFGLSETLFGAIVAPAAGILAVIALPLGRLADKWGTLVSVRYGLLLCAVGMWLVAVGPGYVLAVIGAALLGAGFMAAYPAWMAVASGAGPVGQRATTLGAIGMAEGAGAVIGVIIGPLIYASNVAVPSWHISHYQLPFFLSAILISLSALLAFTWVKRRRGIRS